VFYGLAREERSLVKRSLIKSVALKIPEGRNNVAHRGSGGNTARDRVRAVLAARSSRVRAVLAARPSRVRAVLAARPSNEQKPRQGWHKDLNHLKVKTEDQP